MIHKILGVLGNRDEKYRFSDVCGVVWCGVERFSVSLWTVLVRKVRVDYFLFLCCVNLGSLAGPRSEGRTLGCNLTLAPATMPPLTARLRALELIKSFLQSCFFFTQIVPAMTILLFFIVF